jgi:hypothetical protein
MLRYYDIGRNDTNSTKDNIFILAGEHPRELIAVEFVFKFVKLLCEKSNTTMRYYVDLLLSNLIDKNNFRIIVNANPYSRKKVENGEYCLRVNTRNVDINRNWDIFWQQGDINQVEEFHGSFAFSEPETTFIRDSIKDFKAKLFLSVHSGVYGLYLPYAYSDEEGI